MKWKKCDFNLSEEDESDCIKNLLFGTIGAFIGAVFTAVLAMIINSCVGEGKTVIEEEAARKSITKDNVPKAVLKMAQKLHEAEEKREDNQVREAIDRSKNEADLEAGREHDDRDDRSYYSPRGSGRYSRDHD